MSPDPITTAASAAAIGGAVAALGGAPPDPVIIASLLGALCSAWVRPAQQPDWTIGYIGSTLVHTVLSCGAGMSGAVLVPVYMHELAGVPGWAVAGPAAYLAHKIIPSFDDVKAALIERIRGRAAAPTDSSSTGGQP